VGWARSVLKDGSSQSYADAFHARSLVALTPQRPNRVAGPRTRAGFGMTPLAP